MPETITDPVPHDNVVVVVRFRVLDWRGLGSEYLDTGAFGNVYAGCFLAAEQFPANRDIDGVFNVIHRSTGTHLPDEPRLGDLVVEIVELAAPDESPALPGDVAGDHTGQVDVPLGGRTQFRCEFHVGSRRCSFSVLPVQRLDDGFASHHFFAERHFQRAAMLANQLLAGFGVFCFDVRESRLFCLAAAILPGDHFFLHVNSHFRPSLVIVMYHSPTETGQSRHETHYFSMRAL